MPESAPQYPMKTGELYDGDAYLALKEKYDPRRVLPTLFEKAVAGR